METSAKGIKCIKLPAAYVTGNTSKIQCVFHQNSFVLVEVIFVSLQTANSPPTENMRGVSPLLTQSRLKNTHTYKNKNLRSPKSHSFEPEFPDFYCCGGREAGMNYWGVHELLELPCCWQSSVQAHTTAQPDSCSPHPHGTCRLLLEVAAPAATDCASSAPGKARQVHQTHLSVHAHTIPSAGTTAVLPNPWAKNQE